MKNKVCLHFCFSCFFKITKLIAGEKINAVFPGVSAAWAELIHPAFFKTPKKRYFMQKKCFASLTLFNVITLVEVLWEEYLLV